MDIKHQSPHIKKFTNSSSANFSLLPWTASFPCCPQHMSPHPVPRQEQTSSTNMAHPPNSIPHAKTRHSQSSHLHGPHTFTALLYLLYIMRGVHRHKQSKREPPRPPTRRDPFFSFARSLSLRSSCVRGECVRRRERSAARHLGREL